MKYFVAFCCLLYSGTLVFGQDYRLAYDASTLPELYGNTVVFVEERAGNSYQEVTRGYKLSTNDAKLSRGNKLSFDPAKLPASGEIRFKLFINGKEIPVSLHMQVLKDIRFNLYADSIKPILNYYVNVEGEFTNGKIYPLTTKTVEILANHGSMQGNEWIPPKELNFEKVEFTASSRIDPSIRKTVAVCLKKYKDPRDAEGYEEPGIKDFIPDGRR